MFDKNLMAEVAILYYEKGLTQQEIAKATYLSRQTVSKILNEAIQTKVVEITVHRPQKTRVLLEEKIQKTFGISKAVVCSTTTDNELLRRTMTIQGATAYLAPLLQTGNYNIGLSWGRTVQELIMQFPTLKTLENTVYPLFGATDHGEACFSSNELARSLADKLGANVKYAWFPYLPESEEEKELLKKTSSYKRLCQLWESTDIAIVGIGNSKIIDLFARTFGNMQEHSSAVGDVATHFFNAHGEVLPLYENTLRVSTDALRKASKVVAIACGDDKIQAIRGALCSKLVDILITDEFTAKTLLTL